MTVWTADAQKYAHRPMYDSCVKNEKNLGRHAHDLHQSFLQNNILNKTHVCAVPDLTPCQIRSNRRKNSVYRANIERTTARTEGDMVGEVTRAH